LKTLLLIFVTSTGGIMEPNERDLTGPEGMTKVVLGAAAAFLVKFWVERSVEMGFRKYRKP
jgi:hypothetical protein